MGLFKALLSAFLSLYIAKLIATQDNAFNAPKNAVKALSQPASPSPPVKVDKRYLLYLMHSGDYKNAFAQYQKLTEQCGKNDLEILQKMALLLLEQGINSSDPTIQLLTTYGAGLATTASSTNILKKSLVSSELQNQLIAVHFIALLQDERKEQLLLEAMNSPFLPTRLESAYQMAIAKDFRACGQIEALMQKLPPYFKALFPQLFALLGTPQAIAILKQLSNDPESWVRIEAIYSIAHFKRDDLLPIVRRKLSSGNTAEKECACYTLAALKDSSQIELLKKLSDGPFNENLKLAAAKALVQLDQIEYKAEIENLARNGNLFAIASLCDIKESKEFLVTLLRSQDLNIRQNAAIALLKCQDSRSLPVLKELFIRDSRDLAIQPFFSSGKALFWKIIPSAIQHSKDPTFDIALSLNIKEQLLKETLELPEKDFLKFARELFDAKEHELIPELTGLLENLQTKGSIALLKEKAQKAGAPWIRAWCNLALFRSKEEGPYESNIKKWLLEQKEAPLIQLRPFLPWEARATKNDYRLSPEETSRLLVEIYSAIAASKKEENISLLVEAMKSGNWKNNYALAGLLIRATE